MPTVVPSQVVTVLDQMFPWAAASHEAKILHSGQSTSLAALVDLVEHIPQELLILDGPGFSSLVASLAAIRDTLAKWRSGSSVGFSVGLSEVPGFGGLNPVILIRRALESCPDEAITSEISKLSFVKNPGLRESLRMDISAANGALSNGEWKAATVLSGSVIESLLLWKLLTRRPSDITAAVKKLRAKAVFSEDPGRNLNYWTLHHFIEVAAELAIITGETATEARLAKDYRNLIHPGRAIRLKQKCDRGTAYLAVAALDHVIRDMR